MRFIKYLLVAVVGLFCFTGFAQSEIPKINNRLLVDQAGFLNQQEQRIIEQNLVQFANETSNQILVYITNDIQGYDINDFALRLGEKNKVGQKGSDNGVVIVIKPKTANSRGQAAIQVGYGLEGVIPDITANQIVDNELIGNFKNQQNYQGISSAITVIQSLAKGEFNHQQYGKNKQKKKKGVLSGLFSFLLVLAIIFFTVTKRVRRYAGANNLGFFAAWALLSASSNSHRGHYNQFNSGGGGFGGFGGGSSGGGFGGFGGGGFGGGGASGSW
jgi:uncharacterized protein